MGNTGAEKRKTAVPVWWYSAPSGAALGTVLKVDWNESRTYLQGEVPMPRLNRSHIDQEGKVFEFDTNADRDTVVVAGIFKRSDDSLELRCEKFLLNTPAWNYTAMYGFMTRGCY